MSKRYQRPAFEPDGPFVVRYGFLFNGRQYETGETFDHEGIKVGKLKGLYRRRNIDLCESIGRIKNRDAEPIMPHWSTLNDKEVLRFNFKMTGIRRRNPTIARAELAAMESAGELNVGTTTHRAAS